MARRADYKIHELFIKRWSPRAMSGEEISHEELMSLFEAARWAPSAFNSQPWRFIYAKRESTHWQKFFNLLDPFNKTWCVNAAVLVVITSRKNFEYDEKPSPTHSFDAGAAWVNLALQGSLNGLAVRAIASFDHDKARISLKVPDDFQIEIMIAAGKPGKIEALPTELQKKEFPSDRKRVKDMVFEGVFE